MWFVRYNFIFCVPSHVLFIVHYTNEDTMRTFAYNPTTSQVQLTTKNFRIRTLLKRLFPNGINWQIADICLQTIPKFQLSLPNNIDTGMLCLLPGGLRVRPFLSFPKRHPVIFGSIFSSAKTGLADIIAQKFIEENETIDLRRSAFELFLNSNSRVSTSLKNGSWRMPPRDGHTAPSRGGGKTKFLTWPATSKSGWMHSPSEYVCGPYLILSHRQR